MKVKKSTTETQIVELTEHDIQDILRLHITQQFGPEWKNALYILGERSVAPYMGQLDDEYAKYVEFKLITTSESE